MTTTREALLDAERALEHAVFRGTMSDRLTTYQNALAKVRDALAQEEQWESRLKWEDGMIRNVVHEYAMKERDRFTGSWIERRSVGPWERWEP